MTELLIRAEGNNYVGMGHLKRSLDIAAYLAHERIMQSVLMVRDNPAARNLVAWTRREQSVIWLDSKAYRDEEQAYLAEHSPSVALLDLMTGYTDQEWMQPYLDHVARIVVLGSDPWPVPVCAHVLINPNPCNLAEKEAYYRATDWPREAYLGGRYFVAAPDIAAAMLEAPDIRSDADRVLVFIGGGDHDRVAPRLVEALVALEGAQVCAKLSPASPYSAELSLRAQQEARLNILSKVDSVAALIRWADVVVASHGNVAYEVYALGVPLVAVGMTERQVLQAKEMYAQRANCYVGATGSLDERELAQAVARLLTDHRARREMSARQRNIVDDGGLARIADILLGEKKNE